jgi:hypothetical protein
LATGRYSYTGGGDIDSDIEEIKEEALDPRLRAITPTTRPSTTNTLTIDKELEEDESQFPELRHIRDHTSSASISQTPSQAPSQAPGTYETAAQKRVRESGTPQPTKKAKVSGVGIIDKLGESIKEVATALAAPTTIARDTVDSTIQGQAQEKVQDEKSLTLAGQMIMIHRFTDAILARTYLGLKSNTLRDLFFHQQLDDEETECFVDWSAT